MFVHLKWYVSLYIFGFFMIVFNVLGYWVELTSGEGMKLLLSNYFSLSLSVFSFFFLSKLYRMARTISWMESFFYSFFILPFCTLGFLSFWYKLENENSFISSFIVFFLVFCLLHYYLGVSLRKRKQQSAF